MGRMEIFMTISEIRKQTGLTQKDFAERYHLPLQTLKQWESTPTSTSYRKCPDYILYYLEQLASPTSPLVTDPALFSVTKTPVEEQTPDVSPSHISMSWEAARHRKYRFPVVCPTNRFDISRIHPLKQAEALSIASMLDSYSEIDSAIVFGGATTIRCHEDSDLDIALRLKPESDSAAIRDLISEKIQEATGWKADVIWLNNEEKGSQLYDNIEEGVIILNNMPPRM